MESPLFSMLVILFLLHVRKTSCADYRYSNCSQTFQCGSIANIGYPFLGPNRPDYCGRPEFELNCTSDTPLMTMESLQFRVLNIYNYTYTLNVTRADYWDTYCPSKFANTTIDSSFFEYTSNTQNMFLYYNCTRSLIGLAGISNQFTCDIDNNNMTGYYSLTNLTSENNITVRAACGINVNVPVYQENAQAIQDNNLTTNNLVRVLDGGFGLQWDANNSLCQACRESNGQCGYNSSTNNFVCFCEDQPFPASCQTTGSNSPGSVNHFTRRTTLIGILAVILGALIVLTYIFRRKLLRVSVLWKMEMKTNQNIEAFMRDYASIFPQRYSYSDIVRMTNSFAEKLGHGGFGCVYKGKLPDDRIVAVKVLTGLKGDGEDFVNEVSSISRTSHVNVVSLLGFCYESSKRALVYEFIANGSLDKFIYDKGSSVTSRNLEWETLHRIAVGIARGLAYLHQGCNTRILHFDIKPHNILLDENFCPKISDFGLAKLCNKTESKISIDGARGTIGYIAPEVALRSFGGVSHKSDVYSYGMMVLEMVGGRKNLDVEVSRTSDIYFPQLIYKCLESQENSRLVGIENGKDEEISKRMILVSLWCIQTNPADRPSMSEVIEMIEGSLESLQIPPKPYLCSATRSSCNSTQIVS